MLRSSCDLNWLLLLCITGWAGHLVDLVCVEPTTYIVDRKHVL